MLREEVAKLQELQVDRAKNVSECPEFANDRAPADLSALERHAEDCDACRVKLERIVRQQMGELPSDVHELTRGSRSRPQ